jgi:hypothetical protein
VFVKLAFYVRSILLCLPVYVQQSVRLSSVFFINSLLERLPTIVVIILVIITAAAAPAAPDVEVLQSAYQLHINTTQEAVIVRTVCRNHPRNSGDCVHTAHGRGSLETLTFNRLRSLH